jgi:coatomer subunit beta'
LEENEMENMDEAVPVGADEHEEEEAVLENGNEGEEQLSTNNGGVASA